MSVQIRVDTTEWRSLYVPVKQKHAKYKIRQGKASKHSVQNRIK